MAPLPRTIRKLGTVDCDIVEANPVVWQNRLLRFEYIRWQSEAKHYYGNPTGHSYFRFVDCADGSAGAPFGVDLHMGNAFVRQDRMIVTAVEDWGKSRFYQLESTDLVHWSEPRVILEDPAWQGYNTSVCRADGRFVMVFELGAPQEMVGIPFTMFFAESQDLREWRVIPGARFGFDRYTGGPMVRFFAGWFYLTYLDGSYETGFRTRIVRSRDLREWQESPCPVLSYDESDRVLASDLAPELRERIARAENINASDLDMCEFGGKLHCVYSWGNQRGKEFLALGEADCTEQEFCESYFA